MRTTMAAGDGLGGRTYAAKSLSIGLQSTMASRAHGPGAREKRRSSCGD